MRFRGPPPGGPPTGPDGPGTCRPRWSRPARPRSPPILLRAEASTFRPTVAHRARAASRRGANEVDVLALQGRVALAAREPGAPEGHPLVERGPDRRILGMLRQSRRRSRRRCRSPSRSWRRDGSGPPGHRPAGVGDRPGGERGARSARSTWATRWARSAWTPGPAGGDLERTDSPGRRDHSSEPR